MLISISAFLTSAFETLPCPEPSLSYITHYTLHKLVLNRRVLFLLSGNMYSSIDIVANVLTIFAFSLVNATRCLNLIGEQYLSECVCVCDVKTLKNKFMGETEKG